MAAQQTAGASAATASPAHPAWPWVAVALLLAVPALAIGWSTLPGEDAGLPSAAGAPGATAAPEAPVAARLWWLRMAGGGRAALQLVTAAWVHGSAVHLAANLAGTAVVVALGLALLTEPRRAACAAPDRRRLPQRAALAWLLAWPLTHIGLWADPRLPVYGGASGVLHAGVAVLGWAAWQAGTGPRRRLGLALLAGLAVKTLSEAPWAHAILMRPGWDVPIAPLAHATGAVAGLLCAVALLRANRADRR